MECQICIDTFERDEDIIRYCDGRHQFCKKCFDEWRVATCRSDSPACLCPICRSEIIIPREVVKYYRSGTIVSVCGYLGDLSHGPCKIWYENGKLYEESFFIHNMHEGVLRRWHENGMLKEEIEYLHGKKHGFFRSWNDKGHRDVFCSYEQDTLHGTYQKWCTHQKWCTYQKWCTHRGELEEIQVVFCEYDHGRGQVFTWHSNGKKHEEYFVEDGRWHGPYKSWYPSGKPASVGIYQNGIRDGVWTDWDIQYGYPHMQCYHEGRLLDDILASLDEDIGMMV